MVDKDQTFNLEDFEEALFEQYGDDEEDHDSTWSVEQPEGLIETLYEESKVLGLTRALLVEAAYTLSCFIDSAIALRDRTTQEVELGHFTRAIEDLAEAYDHDDYLVIKYRGREGPEIDDQSGKLDYTIQSGTTLVDGATIGKTSKLQGEDSEYLPERLKTASETFARAGIFTMRISLPRGQRDDVDSLENTCWMLSDYLKAMSGMPPAAKNRIGKDGVDIIILNEHTRPDPNLTMLAWLNKADRLSFQKLVAKIGAIIKNARSGSPLLRCANVYDAIFMNPKFREKAIKPAIEVNSTRWIFTSSERKATLTTAQAELSRELMRLYAKSPLKAAKIIDSLYMADYRDIHSEEFKEIISDVNKLVLQSKKDDVKLEALKQIRGKLLRTPDHVADSIAVEGGKLNIAAPSGDMKTITLHKSLLKYVNFIKNRARTNDKIGRLLDGDVDFDPNDLKTISLEINAPVEEADRFLDIIRKCFRSDGRFYKNTFDKNILFFATNEKKSFMSFWDFLKKIKARDDRVAMLNSLQLFIDKIKRPDTILEVILSDFVKTPGMLDFSERNGLILANILIRKYNKELHRHIELTPEEVLLVKDGISDDRARYVTGFIARDHERFLRKIISIHEDLVSIISGAAEDENVKPLRFLISIERELFILLSLSGGMIERRIIRSAVREYGDPNSDVYSQARNVNDAKAVFQLLQLSIRCLGRFAQEEDIPLFENVRAKRDEFLSLKTEPISKEAVKRVMDHINAQLNQ